MMAKFGRVYEFEAVAVLILGVMALVNGNLLPGLALLGSGIIWIAYQLYVRPTGWGWI